MGSLHKKETLANFNTRIMNEAAIYEATEDIDDEMYAN